MMHSALAVPQHVFDNWTRAVRLREPRALELAHALALALPERAETSDLRNAAHPAQDANTFEISGVARELMRSAHEKYEAFRLGAFEHVDLGNLNIVAFMRQTNEERVLSINNLSSVSQPVKFHSYAGKQGWDILNRVEFTFPSRAQLEAYEFLWLLVD